jgi:hypothetical protein
MNRTTFLINLNLSFLYNDIILSYNAIRTVVICLGDVENRDKWRYRTRVADPK